MVDIASALSSGLKLEPWRQHVYLKTEARLVSDNIIYCFNVMPTGVVQSKLAVGDKQLCYEL